MAPSPHIRRPSKTTETESEASRASSSEHTCHLSQERWISARAPVETSRRGVDRACWPCSRGRLEVEEEGSGLPLSAMQPSRGSVESCL